MRLLLDAHALLWCLSGSAKLSVNLRNTISDGKNDVYVSVVTVWEIEIKKQLGKLTSPDNLIDILAENYMTELPVTAAHAMEAARLPPIHTDPFDRMLIGQARREGLSLVTLDETIKKYDVVVVGV